MSAALSPSAASALLSVSSCVCCATLPDALEAAAVDVASESEAVVEVELSAEPEELCALVLVAPAPPVAEPTACTSAVAVAPEVAPTAVELVVAVCAETRAAPGTAETAAASAGSSDVFGALNRPAC